MKISTFLIFLSVCAFSFGQTKFFEGNQTPTYPDLVHWYDSVQQKNKQIALYAAGLSDAGIPIYVVVLNDGKDSLSSWKKSSKSTIFINNGIHAGEPDGVNACGQLTEEFLKGKWKIPQDVRVVFTLYYNVGGSLNRGSHSRANQIGPAEYGFRGNAKNLDLNRDFIKMDSRNAFTFAHIFHSFCPDLFIDTHVSNGADYQYTLTIIHSLKERMSPSLRALTYDNFQPSMYRKLEKKNFPLVEYVQPKEDIPEKGLVGFNDLPRYANGYVSLFGVIAVTTETHMLKPFEQRVLATKIYLEEATLWVKENQKMLIQARKEHQIWMQNQRFFPIQFERTNQVDSVWFKGFEASYPISEVTGLKRLSYDRSKPFTKKVPYYGTFQATDSVEIPRFYAIEQAQTAVIDRLKANQIELIRISKDTLIEVEIDQVISYSSPDKPYEGHYIHGNLKKKSMRMKLSFQAGDYIVPTQQANRYFLFQVLEPRNEDSYFAWNFFDSHLQQKEYFSDYVFEDLAKEILQNNPQIKLELEQKKSTDPDFAQNPWKILFFIYERSPYFEPTVNRLPVYRIF